MPTQTNNVLVLENGLTRLIGGSEDITLAGGILNTPVTGSTGSFTTLAATAGATFNTAIVQDLTSGRVVIAGTGGEIEDSGNLTFTGGNSLNITGSLDASVQVAAGDITISDGSIVSSSAAISFGAENLSTSGTLASGALTVTGNAGITGDLTVAGDIVSRGAVDLVVQDNFIDLNFGNDATIPLAGGLTVSMNRASAFTASRVTTTVAGSAGVSNPTFTVTDIGGASSLLAQNDIVCIKGMADGGNDGLFQVTAVNQASFPQIVTIAGIGTAGVNASLPFCQSQFDASSGGTTGTAYKVDLAVMAMADGSNAFRDAGSANYAKGTFITAMGPLLGNNGAVLGDFTDPGDYKTASSTLQAAYDGGNAWATSGNTAWQGTLTAGDFKLIGGGDVLMGAGGDTDLGAFSVGSGTAEVITTAALTLTAGSASTWKTSGGALTIESAAACEWSTAAGALALDGKGGMILKSNAADVLTIAANGAVTTDGTNCASIGLESAGGIDIGAANTAAAINVGTAGGRTITVGGASATSLTASAGTVLLEGTTLNLGTENSSGTAINIGTATQANPIGMDAGTGALTMTAAAASSLTCDAALTITAGTASTWSMSANSGSLQKLTIASVNGGVGASGVDIIADEVKVAALDGVLLLEQGALKNSSASATAVGELMAISGAGTAAKVTAAALNGKELAGVAQGISAQNAAIAMASFSGALVQMKLDASGCSAGDILYLGAGVATVTAPVASGDTVYRVGMAAAAIGANAVGNVQYMPSFIANIP